MFNMPVAVTTRPTTQFRKIVNAYPSINAAARAFGLDNATLDRFLSGSGGMSSDAMASIIRATQLTFDDLFEVRDKKD